jgi:hypothetical protein
MDNPFSMKNRRRTLQVVSLLALGLSFIRTATAQLITPAIKPASALASVVSRQVQYHSIPVEAPREREYRYGPPAHSHGGDDMGLWDMAGVIFFFALFWTIPALLESDNSDSFGEFCLRWALGLILPLGLAICCFYLGSH